MAEGVGIFKTPNTRCMIQTLHEKRVISFASPMYFWVNATTDFRGRCRICALLLFISSLCLMGNQVLEVWGFHLYLTVRSLDLFHSLLAV